MIYIFNYSSPIYDKGYPVFGVFVQHGRSFLEFWTPKVPLLKSLTRRLKNNLGGGEIIKTTQKKGPGTAFCAGPLTSKKSRGWAGGSW
jgi:hypothetical protein